VEATVTVFRDTDGAPRYTIGQVQPLADEQRAEAERGRRLREQAARTRAEALAAREQEIAELLQRSLLPGTMPALEHASVCSRYLPGAAGVEVGGDWYDVLGLPDGRIGVVIGDVAGRGVPAASIMGRLRSALRAYALEGEDPGTVLGRLNALEHSYPQPEMATVLYGIYAPSADTLHWASAGHLPVLVREASGDVRVPSTRQGFPIGAVPGAAYETCATPLHQGDIALLYTDGVAERRGEPLDAGLARLRGALRDAPDELDGLCKHVIATTRSDRSDDDVAVLALRAE
jgi:serine phosphatase RsbU (regulator of sigma subunit)